MSNTPFDSVVSIVDSVSRRERSVVEVVRTCLERIHDRDGEIGAFLHIADDYALARAEELDARLVRGERPGSLVGVPVAVKDNFSTLGLPTTCGSRILEGYLPPYDAEVVRRLGRCGAVVVGKTNLDEFGMGSSTEFSAFQVTRNPRNLFMVPGGSSGGSAAAVASGMVPLAIGSDTGGSVRQPAALCGVVGFKPTYGRVSRFGLAAFASSLDTVGPITENVTDCGVAFRAIEGRDSKDSTSFLTEGYCEATERIESLAGIRLGLLSLPDLDVVESEVIECFESAVQVASSAGARCKQVELSLWEWADAAYYVIADAEASSNLARYDGMRFGQRVDAETLDDVYRSSRSAGLGQEAKRRIMLGTFVLSQGHKAAFYDRAVAVRRALRVQIEGLFSSGIDYLVLPTSPTTAWPIGARIGDPLAMYAADLCTLLASLAGLPAISIPCGEGKSGLPIGLQIVGAHGTDEGVVMVAEFLDGLIRGRGVDV